MAGYSVEMDDVAAVGSMLADAAADARTRLEALRHAADRLLGRWQGSAGTDYRHGWAEWHGGAVTLVDALHDMATAVAVSGRTYTAADASVQRAVTGTSA